MFRSRRPSTGEAFTVVYKGSWNYQFFSLTNTKVETRDDW